MRHRACVLSHASVFDPATLSLQGWWRDYAGSAPWAGTASAGSSGSNSLSAGTAPGAGTALNGHGTADFNGTTHYLTGAAMSTFQTTTNLSGWALYAIDTNDTNASWCSNRGVLGTQGTCQLGVFHKSTGVVSLGMEVPSIVTVEQAVGAGTYRLVQWKANGTNLYIRENSAAFTSAAGGTNTSLAANLNVGRSPNSQYFDGRIAELGMSTSFFSDTEMDQVKSYINSRYGLSL